MADTAGKGDGRVGAQVRDGLLTLTLDHPPANALTQATMAGLTQALHAAQGDATIRAVLIVGAGRGFAAGMDPRLFGTESGAIALSDLCHLIETFPKPVTAALHGTCLGAGLELALACHWRIATPQAQLGLPEVNLGLCPCAGASQRLPRLVGGAQALRLLLSGAPILSPEALALGLVDQIAESGGDGPAFARSRPGPRPTSQARASMADLFGPMGALAPARAQAAAAPLLAPRRVIDCVEAAALLPFDAGLALERVQFLDLAASDQARGLRAAWMAERRAGQVPAPVQAALAAPGAPSLQRLGVWAPPDAATEAIVTALSAGLDVILGAPDRDALVAALNRVAAAQETRVSQGRMTESARDADWARLAPVLDPSDMALADLVLAPPAAPEGIPPARRAILGGLPPGLPAALGLTLPDAPGGPAEIALSGETPADLAARALLLARAFGARAVFTGPGGPILARLRRALGQAVVGLQAQGLDAAPIRQALADAGIGSSGRASPAAPSPTEAPILRACLAALAAEGGRLLDSGAALRPCDVDAVAVMAGLVPRWLGGPMAWADDLGLLVLRADLWARAAAQPALYAVPAVFDRLIAEGRRLDSLNTRRPAQVQAPVQAPS